MLLKNWVREKLWVEEKENSSQKMMNYWRATGFYGTRKRLVHYFLDLFEEFAKTGKKKDESFLEETWHVNKSLTMATKQVATREIVETFAALTTDKQDKNPRKAKKKKIPETGF